MQTLERAAALLRGTGSQEGLAHLLSQLGFKGAPLPLDAVAKDALGLPATIRTAGIAQGVGSLRALALDLHDHADLRETLTSVASALAKRSPHLLWTVIATRNAKGEVAIVCWSSSGSRTRIVSLVSNRDRLFESDAETLCALASVMSDSDLLTYSRWLDILGREAITRRFFRTLEKTVDDLGASLSGGVAQADRRELALLYVSRLIFLCFLETKGWLDGDFGFLSNGYSRCIVSGGNYHKRVLEPLFFGTLNTAVRARSARARNFGRIPFLNGGLFSRSNLEKRRRGCAFSDESLGNAYGSLLSRYRFSGREDSAVWSEASIDPEMLGKAFEALMAVGERKSSGAFYTPQALVEEVAERALHSALGEAGIRESNGLRNIRVLDPACGSGAFLVHMLERIAALRLDAGERGSIAEIRRRVLTTSIFGVDLNPMAVWLCELRLWLAIVIESSDSNPMHVVPLPNLDRHIRVGDSLSGGAFGDTLRLPEGRKLAGLRNRYMRASGPRKKTLSKAMDRAERSAAIEVLQHERSRLTAVRKELLMALRARDLFGDRYPPNRDARLQLLTLRQQIGTAAHRERHLSNGAALPFSFAAHFADVAAEGGFDLVVGNPPWVRLHKIPESSRNQLRRDFVVYRNAAWESGAEAAGAGRGFAAQVDMSALFVERSLELLRPGGTMALLLPSKLWRSLAGGGVRQLVLDRTDLVAIEDLTESSSQFEAAVYPSLLVSRKKASVQAATKPSINATVRLRDRVIKWSDRPESLPLDDTPGSPWILLPPPARTAFDRIRSAGAPCANGVFGRPLLGVKTGCNDAFVVHVDGIENGIASISAGQRRGQIEPEMLRPLIRGETLAAWRTTGRREYIVWPHCEDNLPRKAIPPLARRWLLPFRDQLGGRSDLSGRLPWWTIFRTEAARHEHTRVIWADFGLTPRAMVIESGDPIVPLNSCYAIPCNTLDDAHALAALFNGALVAAWLNVLAEPARGGYRRYLGWTVSLLPLPSDWEYAREQLAPLGMRAMSGDIPAETELLVAALAAYRLTLADIQPLLSWTSASD